MKNNRKNSPSYPIGRRIHDIDRLQSYDIQTNLRSYVMLLIIRTWTQSVVLYIFAITSYTHTYYESKGLVGAIISIDRFASKLSS